VTGLTQGKKIAVTVNGEPRSTEAGCVSELLEQLGHGSDRPGIAVAVNGRVVPRGDWSRSRLDDGDTIEVVGAVQGG
jgi:sulfur carrier protein